MINLMTTVDNTDTEASHPKPLVYWCGTTAAQYSGRGTSLTTTQSRAAYLGIFLRSQLEVIPSFLVNHTSNSFSTPSKKWVLLSAIMVARDWDMALHKQGSEGTGTLSLVGGTLYWLVAVTDCGDVADLPCCEPRAQLREITPYWNIQDKGDIIRSLSFSQIEPCMILY